MLIDNFINHIRSVDVNYLPNIILDIGSRDLGQSIEFSSVFKDARVYAFEPNPSQFEICVNLSKNYSNISVERLAISDKNGELDFYVTHGNVGASSLLEPLDVPFGTSKDFTKISVNSIRLDEWLNSKGIDQVDIMWMDTQGIELNALKSMGDHLKKVKFIHCEAAELAYYKGHLLKSDLENFLRSMGFDLIFKNEAYHPYKEGDIIATNMNL